MGGVSAVICEFDPLHEGHRRVIEEAKKRGDTVLAVMSGNLTQRSECALYDKYARAAAAVACGCDVAVELPFPWSCAGAEFFARGGVLTALALGADSFVFGSECAELGVLLSAAELAADPEIEEKVKKSKGDRSAGAASVYDSLFRERGFDLLENDKLAVGYIAAARAAGAENVSFYPVKREPIGEDGKVCASFIREMIRSGKTDGARKYICPEALPFYEDEKTAASLPEKLAELEFLFFRFFGDGEREDAFEATGGVTNLLRRAARSASSPGEFFANAATKKYTNSRLRRAALFSLLGVKKSDLTASPAATVLLACSAAGRRYIAGSSFDSISLLTRPSDVDGLGREAFSQIELMRRADELFSLCCEPPSPAGRFVRMSPSIL